MHVPVQHTNVMVCTEEVELVSMDDASFAIAEGIHDTDSQ